jgi:hypothetical protein
MTNLQLLPLRVEGSFFTWAIRTSDDPYVICAGTCPMLTVGQVRAILDGRARIEGDNVNGYEYVEESTATPAKE